MRAAWTGQSVAASGRGWTAPGNTMQPAPTQQPGPPIWVGGNSRRAIRRAVELGDGWMPMPSPAGSERRLHTPAIVSLDDLAQRLQYAREHAATVGRVELLEIVFMPSGLDMFTNAGVNPGPILDNVHALAELGVTYLTVTLPGTSVQAVLDQVATFGTEVLAPIGAL
jgi:hypothetical protein